MALPEAVARNVPALGLASGSTVLDYGSAESPYASLLPPGCRLVSADLPGNPNADIVIGERSSLPLEDGSIDAVISTQVLEHVTDPAAYLAEAFRALRPGGRMLISTHGTMPYHPDPVDLWRWTSAGLTKILGDAGFKVLHFEGIMGLGATGLQLTHDAVYYRLPRGRLQHAFALVVQALIGVVDRIEPAEGKRLNALVYMAVVEKPR